MTKRLTAQDWIEFGLKTLARDGIDALKADVLARKLGVSRGSFYWHFSDLSAFHARVIEQWKQAATEAIIVALASYQSPEERLEVLLLRAFSHHRVLEIRLRAWADQYAEAARAIRDVDRRRRGYLENLLAEAGIAPAAAATRAQLLYWAYLGAALSRNKLVGESLTHMVGELKRIGFGAQAAGHGAARRRHA